MTSWTDKEIEILKRDYPTVGAKEIASTLNKGYYSVLNKAWSLGLKKDKSFFSEVGKRLNECGKAYRFKKGNIPANKGRKQIEYMSQIGIEKCKVTQFKKGFTPHNTKEDGYTSVRKDKRGVLYKWIKKDGKMMSMHHWVWINTKGAIPKGHQIVFKDKNTLNCDIENLECITQAECMRRNTITRFPSEFITEIKKLSRLKKTINKIEQSNKQQ